jgi:hypothetical protein
VKKLRINGFGGKLFHSEHGQGLAEYALMLGLLLSFLFIIKSVGFNANRVFQWVVDAFH